LVDPKEWIQPPPSLEEGRYWLGAYHSQKCLGVDHGLWSHRVNAAAARQFRCEALSWYQWQLRPTGKANAYLLYNVHSKKCLDVKGYSLDDGGIIYQFNCHGQDNQLWTMMAAGAPGLYFIKSLHSNKCLEIENRSLADGARVIQRSCNDHDHQKWIFASYGFFKSS
jgi:hypothetical protein